MTEPLAEPGPGAPATTSRLLVATDFDGVLAPIVDDPDAVVATPTSMAALGLLADLADTSVAVVSGRSYEFLERVVARPERFTLIGSHGAELAPGALSADERRELDAMIAALTGLAAHHPGLHVEVKALSVAAHLRRIDGDRAAAAAEVDRLAAHWSGKIVVGKEVVEFTLRHTTKGDAVTDLAQRIGATSTVYLGDDTTDEDVFIMLGSGDVGVKVGPGPTAAGHRLADPDAVARFLTELAEQRSAYLVGR
jgi:trehalose 6-phosphate phosphatase